MTADDEAREPGEHGGQVLVRGAAQSRNGEPRQQRLGDAPVRIGAVRIPRSADQVLRDG